MTGRRRSEEHTSELQSPYELVCRLLIEKKKNTCIGSHRVRNRRCRSRRQPHPRSHRLSRRTRSPRPTRARGSRYSSFFFNDTATTEIYTLSLHDALPILATHQVVGMGLAFELARAALESE